MKNSKKDKPPAKGSKSKPLPKIKPVKKADKKPAKSVESPEKKPEDSTEYVNGAEFARRVGVDRSRVTQVINQGKLIKSVVRRGSQLKIAWPAGRDEWENNIQAEHRDPFENEKELKSEEQRKFQIARTIQAEYAAKTAIMDFEVKAGNLMTVESVRIEALKTSKRVRDSLLNLPLKISPRLVGLKDPKDIEEIINDAILECLKGLKYAWDR